MKATVKSIAAVLRKANRNIAGAVSRVHLGGDRLVREIVREMSVIVVVFALLLASPAAAAPLDDAARAYVSLVLEYGQVEEGYVDAYYGPAELATAAKARRRPLAEIERATTALLAMLKTIEVTGPDAKRKRFLSAQLLALYARVMMKQGAQFDFAGEADALFGVRPVLKPLADYDAVLSEIDRLIPGIGPLAERVVAFHKHYEIPKDKLSAVIGAAIAECRRRTAAHVDLPAGESFELRFVTGKPWGGYNYYLGDYKSRIEINTDLPVGIGRAVDLGCHEAYPGHHVYNAQIEQNLTKGRGWIEFSVYPLYSPQSLIAEGTAEYGIDLAFLGDERLQFEQRVLYPLAGLDPAMAPALIAFEEASRQLHGAIYNIASDYLAGRINRPTALQLIQRYTLVDAARATQGLSFIDGYRSYIVNYGLGRDLVEAYVARAGDGKARWARLKEMLTTPILPDDLTPPPALVR